MPCITLRDETEFVETVDTGWNPLAGADTDKIVHAVRTFVPPRDALYTATEARPIDVAICSGMRCSRMTGTRVRLTAPAFAPADQSG